MRRKCSRRMFTCAARAKRYLDLQSRDEIADFGREHWNDDGGVRGRDAQSDIYYTLFASATLRALNARIPILRLRRYISSFGSGTGLDFVHLACLACFNTPFVASRAKRRSILQALHKYRSRDGGFNHRNENADNGTAYGAFLALLASENMNLNPGNERGMLESVAGGPEGGNTMTTAAALLVQYQLGGNVDTQRVDILHSRFAPQGGFCATPRTRVPDLLSTAVAIFALHQVHAPLDRICEPCLGFIESLWRPSGGFAGCVADKAEDCEYTFYALLGIGSLL